MSISSSHQDLFHQPSAVEKISFVRSLMDSHELNADVALALLKSIHAELAQPQPQGQNRSLYASYARMMTSLQHEMPDVHQHVVENWQVPGRVELEEASSEEEGLIETEAGGEAKRPELSGIDKVSPDKDFWETEGEVEGSEAETEEEEEPGESEEKEQGEEQEEEKDELEESEQEEPENEEQEQENEPEEAAQEEEKEVEDNVEESEIEQEELEVKEENGEDEADEKEKEEPEEHLIEGEGSEKPDVEISEEISKTESADHAEEPDHMATEAADAAAHMEHVESETEFVEEEEPPMEAE